MKTQTENFDFELEYLRAKKIIKQLRAENKNLKGHIFELRKAEGGFIPDEDAKDDND